MGRFDDRSNAMLHNRFWFIWNDRPRLVLNQRLQTGLAQWPPLVIVLRFLVGMRLGGFTKSVVVIQKDCGLEDCEALDYIWKKVEWGVFGGFNGWVALDLALASRNGFRTEGAYHNLRQIRRRMRRGLHK